MVKKQTRSQLTKQFKRKATIFRNFAEHLRTTPPFLIDNHQADACEALGELCEQLGSLAQEKETLEERG